VLTLSAGTTRFTAASPIGSAAITLGGGLLELRNDASTNFATNVSGLTANSTLVVDHSIGGTTSGQTLTLGTVALNTTAINLNVVGDHGYNLTTGTVSVKGGAIVPVINNFLSAPGYSAAGYTPGVITLGGVSTDATVANGATLTLGGFGDYSIAGNISSPTSGTNLSIIKTGLGVVTISGNNSTWTSTTQGVLTANGGTTLIDATNTNAVGSANLNGTAGMLEILSATGTANATPWSTKSLTAAGAFTLAVDPLATSNVTGQTVNLGGLTGGSTVTIDSSHGYGVTFNAAGTTAATTTLNNVGNGLVTLAGGLTATTSSTWTLGGPGDFNVTGNVTNGAVTTTFTKSGPGTTTLAGTNTIGGTLTLGGGILRVTNAGAFGGAGGIINQGGNNNTVGSIAFDLRNDTGMDLSSRLASAAGAGYNYAINVDRAIGGSGTNQTMSLGGGAWAGASSASWGFTATGANGYSLQYKGTAFQIIQGMGVTVVNNFIPNISGNGSIIFNSGITFTNTTTGTGMTLGGTGDFLLSGALTSQSGTTTVATVTKSGTGTVTISNDNSTTWNSVLNDEVITASAGIIRLTNGGGLGGANAVYNQNGGTLDLRSDAGITQAGPVVTIGASSTINVDRAVSGAGTGGTQTITALKDNGVFTLYATGGTQSGGNIYNLGVTTFTVGSAATAAVPTVINGISNGGTLNIGTLTGANFAALINGPSNTNVSTALTLGTGTLTKSGTGTLTVGGPAGYAATNTDGAVTVNGGTLSLDFTGITTPANLLQSTAGLTLGAASAGGVSGGTLSVKAAASGATAQTLTTLALQAGQDNITLIAGGTSNTLTFSGAITATNAGSTVLITTPATTTVSVATALNTAATTGRNLVFFDGTNYNWATNTGSGTAFIANNNGAAAAAVQYTALVTTAGTDTSNSQVTASGTTTMGGARTTNSLMINTSGAGGTLALGANLLTLTTGGILFTDSGNYSITGTSATNGLKSATDLVINNYGSGTLQIQAPAIAGTTLTVGGLSTATTVLGNAAVLTTVGTYTGITYINGGTVKLASGIVGLGAAASNTALTENGGIFDINGNTVNIGALNGGPAAVIDNNPSATTAATLTIGAGNGTGTFNGTIKDTNGALTVIKAGTGTITLGDAVTGGSNLFTGNLKFTGASTLNINSLADTAGTKVDFNVTGANLTFVGRSNLTLNSRVIDISAAGGAATITSSSTAGSINGTNAVMTIGSAFAPTGSGSLSLTLTGTAGNIANGGAGSGAGDGISGITGSGNVAVVNAFTGAIGDGTGGGTVALAIAGSGGWSVGGNNTYTGGTTISSTGLVRATSSTAFGTNTVNVTGTPTLDLRSDSGLTIANAFTMNGSFTINVDRAIGGSGYGQIMNIGTLTEATTGKTLIVNNLAGASTQTGSGVVDGYGLHIAGLALTAGTTTTIQNSMGSPGAAEFVIPAAGTGVAGALVIDGVTASASLGAHTLNIGGAAANNFAVTVINGDISQGAGTTLGISVTGGGGNVNFITLAGQTAATNFSGGINIAPGTGLATVRATSQFSLGTGAVSFTGANAGTLEVRNDSSVTYTSPITVGNSSAKTDLLNVGEALNGSSGRNNTFSFGTLGFQGVTANALTVAGVAGSLNNSGDSVTFGGVSLGNGSLNGAATFTVTNSLLLPGMLNLGSITSTNTTTATTQTLTIAGAGVTTLGDVTNSGTAGALTAITYSGSGILDLSRATAANTYTGGLTLTSGTTRVANIAGLANGVGLGAPANNVILNGGILELRSDVNVTYGNQFQLLVTGSTSINVGELAGGTGINGATGVTFTLGGVKSTGAGKQLNIQGIGAVGSATPTASFASSSDSVNLGGVDLNAAIASTTIIYNGLPLPGLLNIGNVTSNTAGASAILTVNGPGVTTVGDVSNGSATVVGLTYSGTGILDLGRETVNNTYTGGLTVTSGTTRVTNSFGLGANTGAMATSNNVILNGGALEVRSDSTVTYSNQLQLKASSALNIGELPGGTGVNGATGITFNFGQLKTATTALTLTIAGIQGTSASSADSVTFTNGVDLNGLAATTITNSLTYPGFLNLGAVTSNAAGTPVLTINGAGVTTLGNVTNGIATTVGITYSGGAGAAGPGILDLSGATVGNTYTGGLTLTGGTVRVTNLFGLGGSSNVVSLNGGTLEIRSDVNASYINNFISPGGGTITLGQLPGGTGATGGYNKTITLGNLTSTVTGKTITVAGIGGTSASSGYSLAVGTVTLNNTVVATTITNNLPLPGTLTVAGVTSVTSANTLTFAGVSGYTTISGDITNGSGTTAITDSGTLTSVLVINGSAGTNYTGGLNLTGTGTLRVMAASGFGGSGNIVALTNGTLDVRNDAGMSIANAVTISSNNVTINADQATSGNLSKTVTFGGAATTLNTTAKVLTLTSGSNFGMTFTNGFNVLINGYTITNNASGNVSLGALNYAFTTANGALTINGSGLTTVGNITGTTVPAALTYSGTGFLDLTGNNGVSNPISGLTLSGAGGITRVSTPGNLGAANDTVTFTSAGTAATLQVRNDNGGVSNGTIAFGNTVALNIASSLAIIDVGNNGGAAATNNTVAFGALTNNTTAQTVGTLTVNGANGYKASFTSLTLPSGSGNTTTLVANVPLNITGAVTNAETGFISTNFDTLTLDGVAGGSISGTISDAVGGSIAAGGTTRILKVGTATWTLAGASSPYVGNTTVNVGTLKLGALNAIGTASAVTITATLANSTATLDLNGNNQTLSSTLTMGGSTATSTPQILLGNGTLTLGNAATAFSYPGTNAPLAAIISPNGGTGTVQLGVANAAFNVVRSATNVVSPNNPFAADVIISAPVTDAGFGGLAKLGTGVLQLSSTSNALNGVVDVQAGTLSVASLTDTSVLKLGLTTVAGIFQWSGTGGLTLNTRAVTLNGTTGGGTIDNSGVNGSNAVVINTALAFGAVSSGIKTLTLTGTNTDANTIGAITDNGTSATSVTKSGVGKWVIGATSTITGTLTVSAGTLGIGASSSTGPLAVTGGTLDLGSNNLTVGAETLTTAGASIIGTSGLLTATSFAASNATGNTTISAIMAGSGVLTKTGLGSLTLSGVNTFTGNVVDSVGNIIITKSQALGLGPKTISIIPSANPTSLPGLRLDGSGGAITLAANLSFTTSFDALSAGVPIANNGAIINDAGNNTILGNFTLTSGGGGTTFLSNAGNLVIAGNIAASTSLRTVLLRGAGSGQITGVVSDGTNPVVLSHDDGVGSWTLAGANTYTGGTNIPVGTLRLGGGDNRLLSTGGGAANVVTLGSGTTSGKLIIGGDASGGTGVGTQHNQTLTQNTATSILTTSGTGLLNSVVGGADGGTSAGTPANNSTLTLNIGGGFTDTYNGLIGGAGTFENNINLNKNGGGTLVLGGDLSLWTGTGSGPTDPTRPLLNLNAGVLILNGTINTAVINFGGLFIDNSIHGANFSLTTLGGLVSFDSVTDSFASNNLVAASHGVASLNIPNNTGVTDYAGSDMYLGATGARVYAGTTLAAGASNTYRFGGGSPWNAPSTASSPGSGGYLQVAALNVVTGANNVIIGDNGTYNGGGGIFGNLSTVEFTAAQNFTGTLSLLGGTLQFTNSNQLGSPSVSANSILLDGGVLNNGFNAVLRYGASTTTDLSARIGIVSGGSIDTGANNVIFATAIGNANAGTGGLNKIGNGTLTLTGNNTYVGPTGVGAGILQLNGATGSLSSSSNLTFGGGGTFRYDNVGAGGTVSQTMGGLSVTAGDATLLSARTVAQNTNLIFSSLTVPVTGSTLNVAVTGTGSTAAINEVSFTAAPTAGQFIDGHLFFGGTEFAVYDSLGFLRALSYGTDKDSTGTITSVSVGATTTLGAGATGANVNLTGALSAQVTQTVESLKISGAVGITFAAAGNILTVNSGGIIKTGATANFGSAAANGIVQAGATGTGDLVVRLDAAGDVLVMNSSITAGSLTKSGAGTLTLATANTIGPGPITINGGVLGVAAQNEYGTASGFTLNGGTLNWTAVAALPKLFTLGINGGGLNITSAGNENIGTLGDALGFLGAGARTLTLNSVIDRKQTFQFVIGDNGGPTSLAISGAGDTSLMVLNANNTYTGTTTINRGILQLANAGALPGGLGGASITPSNTGGGNLIFAAAGTNRGVLELTDASGGFFRSPGTGFDQVQWTGNGGFSNASTTQNLVVNLGGTGALQKWASGNFVPNGSILEFGEGAGNGNATGTFGITFQNGIDLNGASRTIQVDNTNAPIEAIISGNLSNTSGTAAVLNKSGAGALQLTGTNNAGTGALTTTVTGGYLVLGNMTTAVPGAGGDTSSRSITILANGGVVLQGATDLSPLLNRITSASTGVVALDTSSSVNVDFSDPTYANIYLGAYSNPGGTPIYYSGTITPNSNTYKFASVAQASPGAATGGVGAAFNVLVLNSTNMLANNGSTVRSVIFGGNSTAQGGTGVTYLTGYNTYTGGTIVGEASGAGTNTDVGVGNDSAFGTGLITLNDGRLGALNGDHTLSNNIKTNSTTVNISLGGSLTSDGVANGGGMTILGSTDLSTLTTGGLFSRSAAQPIIFIGDVKTNASNNLSLVVGSLFEFLTTPAGAAAIKTMNTGGKGISYVTNPSGGVVIDSANSLGAAPAANSAAFFNLGGVTNATLQVLPGIIAPIALSPNEGLTTSSGALFAFTVNGAPTINDSTGSATSGLIGNSQLTFAGVISGSSSGAPALNKLGFGTLTLTGKNTATLSNANGISIAAGTMKLDFANSAATDPIFTVTTGLLLGNGTVSGSVGTASSLVTSGVTLALVGKSGQTNSQTFGAMTNAAKDNNIVFTQNGATGLNLTLGVITNTLGGTIAVTLPTAGTFTIANTNTVSTQGILVDAGGNPYVIVGGTEWGALSGTSLVAGSTASGSFYTANSATALTASSNADLTTSAALSAASTSVASLRLNTNSALTLGLGANSLVTGGILMGTGAGSSNQVISSTTGTLQGTQVSLVGKNLAIYQADTLATLTISAIIANNSAASTTPATALSKAGPGTLILTGANTYTGVTYFNGGTISVGAVTIGGTAGPLGGAASNAATNLVFSSGTLQYTGATGTTDRGATFASVSAIDVTQSGTNLTLASSTIGITGLVNTPGMLRKIGAGTLTIGGTGSDTNLSVEVAAGTLNLGKASGITVQQPNGAALIIDSGATARVTGAGTAQVDTASSVVSNGTFDLNAVSQTFDGLAGAGTVTSATGAPTLTLGSGNDVAIGAYTVGAAAAGVASTGLNNFGGAITGTIALTKAGAGTQILGGAANTYSGATTITAGTLRLGITNALPNGTGKGNVIIIGNTVVGGLIVPGTLDLGGFDQAINGLNSTTGGFVTNTPTVSFNTAWGTTVGGVFSAAATSGTDVLTVGNGNAAGAFNGVLQDGFSVVPGTTPTSVNGILALTKTGTGTQVLSGPNTATGSLTVNQGEVDLNTSGNNAWSGNAVVAGGTLKLLQSNQLSDSRSLAISSGTFDLGGFSETVGGFSGTGGVVDNTGSTASTLFFGSNNANGTFDGVIQNSGAGALSIVKQGSGTQVLSGVNTYSGTTTVADGKLVVAGSISGTLTVSGVSTAILASGHGTASTIGGNVTLQSAALAAGILAPGDTGDTSGTSTIGRLNVNGDLTVGGAGAPAHLAIEIGGTTAGTLSDLVKVASTSTVTLTNANLDLTLANSFNPTTLTIATYNSGTNQLNQNGSLIFIVTGSANAIVGTFANAGAADGSLTGFGTYTLGGQEFAISYTADINGNLGAGSFTGGHDIALMAIPEPNSLAMLAGSLGMALGLQRFRRRRS